jgi:SAM-dependent methyltransferase
MGRWSARLAPLFVEFARVRDGDRVLDVGCGTGSLVQAVAEIAPRSQIVGIDLAGPFIEYCRSRFSDPRITFDRGSALDLPYPDGSFDRSLSLLVFQHLPQPEKAAMEMRRVTRPGGTVATCTWDSRGLEMNAILREEAARLEPSRGDRPERGSREGQLAGLWRGSGLEGVEEIAFDIQTDFSSFDDYWSQYAGGVGPTGAFVAGLSPELRDALREALRKRILAGGPDRPFSLRARAWAVRGTVPSK